MKETFRDIITEFAGDVYVGDYTEYAKQHPEKQGIGVIFNPTPFPDINSLHLINRRPTHIATVDFEKCPAIFTGSDGHKISQCEGMCFASRSKGKGWCLLIEMKYCLEHNISGWISKAIEQLTLTLEHLRDKKGIIPVKRRIYWVLSIPDHSECEPFSSFEYPPDRLLELQESWNVTAFFRCNTIEVLTDTHLRAVSTPARAHAPASDSHT